jgi:hypothetical protein
MLSHAAVLVLGMLAGTIYWSSHRSTTDSLISMLARKPLADASNVAFRFGSPDHARILLNELLHAPSEPATAARDEMVAQLHLAALSGEYQTDAPNLAHIEAASLACQRSRSSNCEPKRMKELAAKFALQRRD